MTQHYLKIETQSECVPQAVFTSAQVIFEDKTLPQHIRLLAANQLELANTINKLIVALSYGTATMCAIEPGSDELRRGK